MFRGIRLAEVGFSLWMVLAGMSPAQDRSTWDGAMVMPKESGTRVTSIDQTGGGADSGALNRIVYVVIKEQGPRIMVRQYGVEVWLAKNDAVLLNDAPEYFSRRIQDNPADDRAWALRGEARRWKGQLKESIADLTEAIRLNPENPAWRNNRALGYHNLNDQDSAIADYTAAIRLDPTDSIAFYNRANAWRFKKEFAKAVADYLEAIRLQPRDPNPYNGVAWVWATCPSEGMRDGQKAVEYARKACELENWRRANDWGTLAAAYAEAGQFEEAKKWQTKALGDSLYSRTYEKEGKERLQLYSQGKAYREDVSQFARK